MFTRYASFSLWSTAEGRGVQISDSSALSPTIHPRMNVSDIQTPLVFYSMFVMEERRKHKHKRSDSLSEEGNEYIKKKKHKHEYVHFL